MFVASRDQLSSPKTFWFSFRIFSHRFCFESNLNLYKFHRSILSTSSWDVCWNAEWRNFFRTQSFARVCYRLTHRIPDNCQFHSTFYISFQFHMYDIFCNVHAGAKCWNKFVSFIFDFIKQCANCSKIREIIKLRVWFSESDNSEDLFSKEWYISN